MVPEIQADAELECVDPRDHSGWDEEVSGYPGVSVFHSSAWARVLADCYGHRPVFQRVRSGSRILAHVPLFEVKTMLKGRRGVSAPFADFCGLLTRECDGGVRYLKLLEGVARTSRWRHLELRGGAPGPDEKKGVGIQPTYLGHNLPLGKDSQTQMLKLSSGARRSLGKAEASDLTASITSSSEGLAKFYDLHARTRRRLGSPPQPLRFFRLIYSHLIEPGMGFVSLVERGSQPVAGALFLHFGGNGLFKFGASDERELEMRPNHLAIWSGIRELVDRGVGGLHFGRTTPAQEGLSRFKRSWGAEESPMFYRRFLPHEGRWRPTDPQSRPPGTRAFQFMPLPISRLAGRLLYPQFD